jgi:hypothetical protein
MPRHHGRSALAFLAAAANAGTAAAAAAACSFVPAGALDSVPCINIPHCNTVHRGSAAAVGGADAGVVSQFWVSTTPGFVEPAQNTTGRVCYDDTAVRVHLNASDSFIFTPWVHCNDPVYEQSDVLEVGMCRAVGGARMWGDWRGW